jgi:hypothetical protein
MDELPRIVSSVTTIASDREMQSIGPVPPSGITRGHSNYPSYVLLIGSRLVRSDDVQSNAPTDFCDINPAWTMSLIR